MLPVMLIENSVQKQEKKNLELTFINTNQVNRKFSKKKKII